MSGPSRIGPIPSPVRVGKAVGVVETGARSLDDD
jgi:hypothetical protein